ncbi:MULTISPECIES: tripartite tricarboxylate transporter substrate-binding protein [unclassified Paraburkholderia]|uniref:tripartite tricarboxylate transporter substrate-binding protein n=1 Tax=unclassified Paraburkholderia TaxID=2615204 RepID=UPI00161D9F6E|nr:MULTISPECIES: tripartite tricarboxylate transporter substrate-binding protein [unclassified Paraburkholderia]MBB5445492.1 tripartite-type tricarboxylate transporter receptor subunit TctC [Paraburkholderia sp. WSM4177]MBB5486028.1 tripartite-type tricarboxylate transporter receptor subunit TctC [Paraburkholderia sp. WSM4180]
MILKLNRKLFLSAVLAADALISGVAFAGAPAKPTPAPVPAPAAKPAAAALVAAPAGVVLVAEIGKGVSGTDIKDYADLISRLKDNPDCYTFGTTADGARDLTAMTTLQKRNGVRMVKLSYKDTAAEIEGLMKARVQVIPVPYEVAAPYIKSGQMRPLVVFGSARIPEIKDVPTASEVMPGFVY